MEREIYVANTRTQTKSKITSSATTLGELKADLTKAGIDYSGLSFTEGFSNTMLLDDTSLLPATVMNKGVATTTLLILLTNTKKNISSGLGSYRSTLYKKIQDGHYQEDIKKAFGKNYTMVSSTQLEEFLNTRTADVQSTPEAPEETAVAKAIAAKVDSIKTGKASSESIATKFVRLMVAEGLITVAELQEIALGTTTHELFKADADSQADDIPQDITDRLEALGFSM